MEVWDNDEDALHFAECRGFAIERHSFQSVLAMSAYIEPDDVAMFERRRSPYIRTDNDSINEPIPAINRKLGYKFGLSFRQHRLQPARACLRPALYRPFGRPHAEAVPARSVNVQLRGDARPA